MCSRWCGVPGIEDFRNSAGLPVTDRQRIRHEPTACPADRHRTDGGHHLGNVRAEGADLLALQPFKRLAVVRRPDRVVGAERLVEQPTHVECLEFLGEGGNLLERVVRNFDRFLGRVEDEGNLQRLCEQQLIGEVSRNDCPHVDGAAAGKGQQFVAGTQTAREDDIDLDAPFGALLDGIGETLLHFGEGAVRQIVSPVELEFLRLNRGGTDRCRNDHAPEDQGPYSHVAAPCMAVGCDPEPRIRARPTESARLHRGRTPPSYEIPSAPFRESEGIS